MAQSLQFFRRIMLLLNVTVGAFLVWVFGMTPVLAARQSDGVAFAQNLSALPAKPWTLVIAVHWRYIPRNHHIYEYAV